MHRFLIALIIQMLMLTMPCQADSFRVKVALPDYPITLNGNTVNTAYSQYPPIVYQGVTYLPFTYNNSRNLGLETAWSDGTGLTVVQTGIFAEYAGSVWKTKNKKAYEAIVALYPVTVNGKTVDNTSEEYPLLEFRQVTYFPMTWHYGVEEFGWEMAFNTKKGLAISCDHSYISRYPLKGITKASFFTIIDDVCYYGGLDDQTPCVFMAPVTDPAGAVTVYRFDEWNDPYFTFPGLGIGKYEGKVYLTYHTGGATMGTDHVVLIRPDGTTEEILSGYQDFAMDGENIVVARHFVPPAAGTLEYRAKDGKSYPLGASDYYYGWMRHRDGQGDAYEPSGYVHVQDGWVTINAFQENGGAAGNFMWRINIATNEMQQLTHIPMKSFAVDGNDILFQGAEDSKLYKGNLLGGDEAVLIDEAILRYERQGDDLWYTAAKDGGLYLKTGNGPTRLMLPGLSVDAFAVNSGVAFAVDLQNNWLYAVSRDMGPKKLMQDTHATQVRVLGNYTVAGLDWEGDRGLAVFSSTGKLLFKTSDETYYYQIIGDTLYYKLEESSHVYKVHLRE